MRDILTWHGCLAFVFCSGLTAHLVAEPPCRVPSRVFEIDYKINETALPLDSIQLWYTLDDGETWHPYGYDEDRQSPFTFHAPVEGRYGFFLRALNASGPSSDVPTRSTPPHFAAFVDFTPPVAQLHELRPTTSMGQRIVQIRWTAIDAHLLSRPVEIEYRRGTDEEWLPVAPEPLANTGRFDWRVPEDVDGVLRIRFNVTDEGGNRITTDPQTVEMTQPRPTQPLTVAETASPDAGGVGDLVSPAPLSTPARKRALELYREGLADRDAGDHHRGIARMREAISLDPQLTEAFAELGGMLYLLGDFERALAAYDLALSQKPTMRSALQGSAKAYRQMRDYPAAAQRLRKILRYSPNDAETWMNLGDIAIFQGDEVLARECYLRATQIDPTAEAVIEQARQRLALMAEVSRTYQGER